MLEEKRVIEVEQLTELLQHRTSWGRNQLLEAIRGLEILANNEPTENYKKSLGNTCANGATKNVRDIVFWGDGDIFKLISKASSEKEGWMKSTKAMQCGSSLVVQVTTQQRNPDGSYSVAEALTTVPNAEIIATTVDGVITCCIYIVAPIKIGKTKYGL